MAKRTKYMRIMLSDREQEALKEAAWSDDNTPIAAWVRDAALAKARRNKTKERKSE